MNVESRSREVFLTVVLPETAFISRFAIEVGGELFVAYVREKEAAWKEYQHAVTRGKTAGRRHRNIFLKIIPRLSIPRERGGGGNKIVYSETFSPSLKGECVQTRF